MTIEANIYFVAGAIIAIIAGSTYVIQAFHKETSQSGAILLRRAAIIAFLAGLLLLLASQTKIVTSMSEKNVVH